MLTTRTDLAVEAHAIWRESAGKTGTLSGVRAETTHLQGFAVERVEILDGEGERALGKARGTYLTMDISGLWRREAEGFSRTVTALAALLRPMVPEEGPVLVAGLGNRAMTADAIGPLTADRLLVTRHLGRVLPMLRPVAAVAAGVLGTTGMEAAEWVRGAAERVQPRAVILVDALCARETRRLCASLQLSDTGLTPGSGVGNHRMALDGHTLGVPVISLGVPTVVTASTILRDALRLAGREEEGPALPRGEELLVTSDSIDQKVSYLAKVLGWGISMALQPKLELADLAALVE